jgi:hypothetical protein
MPKTYCIKANKTAADVVANNDITLNTGLTLDEAWRESIKLQKAGGHVAVWIEEEKIRKPHIVRSIERDPRNGVKLEVVRCDGCMI